MIARAVFDANVLTARLEVLQCWESISHGGACDGLLKEKRRDPLVSQKTDVSWNQVWCWQFVGCAV